MSALAAEDRRSTALSQAEILEVAAGMALGEGSTARDLIKSAFENPAGFMADHYPSFRAQSVPFDSEHWAEMPAG